MLRVPCVNCGRVVQIKERLAGRRLKCAACRLAASAVSPAVEPPPERFPAWLLLLCLLAGLFLLLLLAAAWFGSLWAIPAVLLGLWIAWRYLPGGPRPVRQPSKADPAPAPVSVPVTAPVSVPSPPVPVAAVAPPPPPAPSVLDEDEHYTLFHGTVAIGAIETWHGEDDDPAQWVGTIEFGPGFYGGKLEELSPLAEFIALGRLRGQLLREKRDASHIDSYMQSRHGDLVTSEEWRVVDSQNVSIPIYCPIVSEELVIWERVDGKTWR